MFCWVWTIGAAVGRSVGRSDVGCRPRLSSTLLRPTSVCQLVFLLLCGIHYDFHLPSRISLSLSLSISVCHAIVLALELKKVERAEWGLSRAQNGEWRTGSYGTLRRNTYGPFNMSFFPNTECDSLSTYPTLLTCCAMYAWRTLCLSDVTWVTVRCGHLDTNMYSYMGLSQMKNRDQVSMSLMGPNACKC